MGGSIMLSLLPLPSHIKSDKEIGEYYHKTYPCADVDVFIYGALNESHYKKLVQEFVDYMKKMTEEMIIVQTPFTISFIIPEMRKIQLVLGHWRTLDELMINGDIDCGCVGFNGQ